MPSFSVLPGFEGFLLELSSRKPEPRAGLSIITLLRRKAEPLKDQPMLIIRPSVPAFAGLLLALASPAATITQNFSSDPFQAGWQVFGNSDLFRWNSQSQRLEVTWDSTQNNSYCFHPLGTSLSRNDDFTLAFDLLLTDIVSGNEPGKTGGLELGIGLVNFAGATSTNFMRGVFGSAPGLVEFDYFPAGYYDFGGMIYEVPATTTPTFISTNGFDFAPTVFAPYSFELPTNVAVRVSMTFNASSQTLVTDLTTNGLPLLHLPDVVLTDTNRSGFTGQDDYRVDTFSISSYSSTGDDFDSVLAHASVDNITLNYPLPIENLTGNFSSGNWRVQFGSRSNWVYVLERAAELHSWTPVAGPLAGTAEVVVLTDASPPANRAFYRVRAARP
jgi:hypothetical protein